MIKRLLSLLLCLILVVPVLAACSSDDDEEEDKGAYIKMYLSDLIYDLDPAFSMNNNSQQQIVSLVFSGLFKLDEKGRVQKDLVKDYEIISDDNAKEYKMILTLHETRWSDSTPLDAADVIYSFKRILDVENSNPAAPLLFDIKNARDVVEGECSIDDLGVTDPDELVLEITFERKIDYNQFMLNLTSPALVPLREDIIERNDDWAKKPATIVASGPFVLRNSNYKPGEESMTFERNAYYFRDKTKDDLDKSVTPYRIMVDFSLSDEEIKQKYDGGEIFYIGEIPLSLREYYADDAEIADEMSTHAYYFNQKALINDGGEGEYLFANESVRRALSLAIDRDTIANSVIFAKAATALIPYGVFESSPPKSFLSSVKQFREEGGDLLAITPNEAEAKSLLSTAGITPSKYSFSITVRAEDEVHLLIAEAVQKSWQALGFNVSLNKVAAIVNDDENALTKEVAEDIMDDIYNENFYSGEYEVIAHDFVVLSPDAFSILAPYAKAFSGQAIDMIQYDMMPHITGFDDEVYNALIEKIFAITNYEERAELLHQAERLLLEKMPIVPIIFNQDAYVISRDLSKYSTSYYQNRILTKLKLKNYELYVETTVE